MSAKSASKSPPPPAQRRSDFDLEPNPFEQSFSATPRSASSNLRNSSPPSDSSASRHKSPSPSRPVLPPLASISSPADPSSYPWTYPNSSINNSLRAGPLSPAMLAGPQSNNDQSSHLQFDGSSFRTGLTPRTGMTPRTGLTPGTGLTPLVGGPVAFPPSPGTAAFLAIMNNGSNGQSTITPNTLSAITGVLSNNNNNNNNNGQHHQPSSEASTYVTSASNAATSAANGLFLLSQAHQELTKREEAQARAGNANLTSNPHSVPNGKRGTKRKSYDPASPPPSNGPARGAGKRTRATARKPSPRISDMGDEDDDDDDDDGGDADDADLNSSTTSSGRRSTKKPETEEEKRRNFLERNRQAALKCRQRKKAWLAQLQAKVEYLSNENERLTSALVSSREEISRLGALVGGAGVVGPVSLGVGAQVSGPGVQPVSMNVSLPNKAGAGATNGTAVTAGGGGGRGSAGYGY